MDDTGFAAPNGVTVTCPVCGSRAELKPDTGTPITSAARWTCENRHKLRVRFMPNGPEVVEDKTGEN